jgi:Ni,Fe-hydrogenase III large subunit
MSSSSAFELATDRSPGIHILFAYTSACGALERALEVGEHPDAVYQLRAAVDALERAHRALVDPNGTAILRPGEPEPVE